MTTTEGPGQDRGGKRALARWGRFVARHAVAVAVVPFLLAIACLPLLASIENRLSSGGWLPDSAESIQVDHRLDDEFGRHSTAHYILFSDPTGQLVASDPEFRREVERTLAPLRGDSAVTAIYTWGTAGDALKPLLISADGARSLAVVLVNRDVKESAASVPHLRETLHSDLLEVQIGGWPATTHDFRELTSSDLTRAKAISLPLTILILVILFGGLLVAGLPLLTTLLALAPTLAIITVLSRIIETSVFTVNVVIMIGLAVGIDYALILVSRYREELARHNGEDAMAVTMATAGVTIVASGAAVAIGLLGLLTFGVPAATATGIAASAVVFLGVGVSLSVLPALLILLGDRARGRPWHRAGARASFMTRWGLALRRIRSGLDRRPGWALTGSVLGLLLLAAPVFGMNPEPPTMQVLPTSQPARQMYDDVQASFPAATLSPITIIVEPRNGRPMTQTRNLSDLADFVETLEGIEGVDGVVSVWSFLPAGIGPGLLSGGVRADPELATVARPYLTDQAAVIEINVHSGAGSDEAKAIVDLLRTDASRLSDGRFTVMVGGETATSVDLVNHVAARAPWTIGLVLAATALVLFLQFRSVVLPIKAILLNMLSLTASFGALVWVFQDGHLSGVLGFEPLGYTVVIVPVLMFCFMFGLSMDYEVIMLSRIREAWLETGDNTQAVRDGLRGSARIVTSAALVMLVVFAAFGTSRLQVIQQIGLGLAVAVFVDATLIRLVALPAAMQLMGRWNWWAPAWTRPAPRDTAIPAEPGVRSS